MPAQKKATLPSAPMSMEKAWDAMKGWGVFRSWEREGEAVWRQSLLPLGGAFLWLKEVRDGLETRTSGSDKTPVLPKTPTQKKKTRGAARLAKLAALRRAEETAAASTRRPLFSNNDNHDPASNLDAASTDETTAAHDTLHQQPPQHDLADGHEGGPVMLNDPNMEAEVEEAPDETAGDDMMPRTPATALDSPVPQVIEETPPIQKPRSITNTPATVKQKTPRKTPEKSPGPYPRIRVNSKSPRPRPVSKSPARTPTISTPAPMEVGGSPVTQKSKTPGTMSTRSRARFRQVDGHEEEPPAFHLQMEECKLKAAAEKKAALLQERSEAAKRRDHAEAVKARKARLEEERVAALKERMEQKETAAAVRAATPVKARMNAARGAQLKATAAPPSNPSRPPTPAKSTQLTKAAQIKQQRMQLRKRAEAKRLEKLEHKKEDEQRLEAEEAQRRQLRPPVKKKASSRSPNPETLVPPTPAGPVLRTPRFKPTPSPATLVPDSSPLPVPPRDHGPPPEDPKSPHDPRPSQIPNVEDTATEEEDIPSPPKKPRRDTFQRKAEAPKEVATDKASTETEAVKTPVEKEAVREEKKEGEKDRESYQMTPLREPIPPSLENYNIDDLRSDDETDDENEPRKKIPEWALGRELKAAVIRQHFAPVDPKTIFGPTYAPILDQMFARPRSRFYKRTSSAVWDSPLLPPPKLHKSN